MKILRYKLFIILLLLLVNNAYSAIYGLPRLIDEISQLYASGRNDVVKAKLQNNGFQLSESTPDYELNGKYYKSNYKYFYSGPDYRGNIEFSSITDDYETEFEILVSFHSDYAQGEIEELRKFFLAKPNFKPLEENKINWLYEDRYIYGRNSENAIIGKRPFHIGSGYNNSDKSFWIKVQMYRPLVPVVDFENDKLKAFSEQPIENIQMKKNNGHYYIRIVMAGKGYDFLFDTGASDFLINSKIERDLIVAGIIRDEDYLPPQKYETANGIVTLRRVKIVKLKFGNITLTNIEAGISPNNATPLFGVNALNKFQTWKVNSKTNVLTIKKF
jgi:clan AA aspartic protease (TIGR02281 family)